MSEMHVKPNAHRVDQQHQTEALDQKKQLEKADTGKPTATDETRKNLTKYTGHEEHISAPSVSQKKEEAKRAEEVQSVSVAQIQRELQMRGGGVRG
jgi:hypothetical protein